jgi:hypothetical protein
MLSTHSECIVLYCELACDLDAQFARKESTAAAQRAWFLGFYAILTAQADADSNQPPASPKGRHVHTAPHGSVKIYFTKIYFTKIDLYQMCMRKKWLEIEYIHLF